MFQQSQSLTSRLPLSIFLSTQSSKLSLSLSKTTDKPNFNPSRRSYPSRKSSFQTLKCSVFSVVSEPTHLESTNNHHKPFPAEVSRTIMELTSVGTLSTLLTQDDAWPLGIGVRFAVDAQGTPILCLNDSNRQFSLDRRSSLHVQLEQSRLRTPQCTIQGSLDKPEDRMLLKKLCTTWEKRFGEEVNDDLIYIVAVERVFQMDDFTEDGVWVTSSDYKLANPDPLRDFAERIVSEINTHNREDVHRFCNIFVDVDFQVTEAKMVWVDRFGFDMHLTSPQSGIFEARIPFPREVTDEKGVKSSFNGMSQLAWEVEKNYHVPDFKKVKQLKKIACRGH
ncbi:glutamyl-tRNA reductase-binding protein, chloroplastic [Rhododendron vialii]|uniref:glutamyl-tRNA reductase-binding protein, chloroplastic n=1 Tax=Rhododendron vialii TaxID=182163 RepID=UPI00265EB64D|nr:glutamyl-tRNA reductase-binding protein, chloroplastic [Rhododendron vialii]